MRVQQHDISDCGPACMTAILAHWGRLEPIHALRDLSGTTLSGTSLAGLRRVVWTGNKNLGKPVRGAELSSKA